MNYETLFHRLEELAVIAEALIAMGLNEADAWDVIFAALEEFLADRHA